MTGRPGAEFAIFSLSLPTQAQTASALTLSPEIFADSKGVWSHSSAAPYRSQVLSKLAKLLHARAPDLAVLEARQTGRCLREMRAQLSRVGERFDYFAALSAVQEGSTMPVEGEMINIVSRAPLGVCAQLTSWNHRKPTLYLLSCFGLTKDVLLRLLSFTHRRQEIGACTGRGVFLSHMPLSLLTTTLYSILLAGDSVIVKPSEVGSKKIAHLGLRQLRGLTVRSTISARTFDGARTWTFSARSRL